MTTCSEIPLPPARAEETTGLEPPSNPFDGTPYDDACDLPDEELPTEHDQPRTDREAWSPLQLEKRGLSEQIDGALARPKRAKQGNFEFSLHVVREQVAVKLLQAGRDDLAAPLLHCHTEKTVKRCNHCGKVQTFHNRCDKFYCPSCQPRLARERKESITWWVKEASQAKHVVLTARNSALLTKARVQEFKAALKKLRRSALAKNWRGGLWSLEVTNEGRGWHLHAHLLIDADWIDARALSETWARCIGQDFAIVCVKDARDRNYLAEVTKYAVKGSSLATWTPEEVAAFVDAMSGGRNFGTWGSLYKRNAEFRQWLEEAAEHANDCECGACDWRYFSPDEYDWFCIERENSPPPQRPASPASDNQGTLCL